MGNIDSSAFPYKVRSPVALYQIFKTCWDMFDATDDETGLPVTIFTFDKVKYPNRIDSAKNYMSILRTLRYPGIIKYLNAIETPTHIHIVTERLKPLTIPFTPPQDEDNTVFALQKQQSLNSSSENSSNSLIEEKVNNSLDFSTKPISSRSSESVELLLSLGIQQIITTLEFLNSKAHIVHCNLNPSSIFIAENGDWKLGGFDIAFRVPVTKKNTTSNGVIIGNGNIPELTRNNVNIQRKVYLCDELQKNRWKELESCLIHTIDAYSFGVLVNHLFNVNISQIQDIITTNPDQDGNSYNSYSNTNTNTNSNTNTNTNTNSFKRVSSAISLPTILQAPIKQFTQTSSLDRPHYSLLLSSQYSSYFLTQCSSTIQYLDNIDLKTIDENNQFFRNLSVIYSSLPNCVLKQRILPQLIQMVQCSQISNSPSNSLSNTNITVSGSGAIASSSKIPFAVILSNILLLSKFVQTPEQYASHTIPIITRLFHSNERAVRVHLLQNVREYSKFLTEKNMTSDILDPLLFGLSDSHHIIRELTIKSLPLFSHLFSVDTIMQTIIPALTPLLSDDNANNRVFAVYSIAKLSQNLGDHDRSSVTITICGRALKDTYFDVRNVSLEVLYTTLDVFTVNTLATKIIPYISRFLIDPHSIVRKSCSRLIQASLEKIDKYDSVLMKRGDVEEIDNFQESENSENKNSQNLQNSQTLAKSSVTVGGYTVDTTAAVAAASLASNVASSMLSSMGSWASNAVTNALVSGTGVAVPSSKSGNFGNYGNSGNSMSSQNFQSSNTNSGMHNSGQGKSKYSSMSGGLNSVGSTSNGLDDSFSKNNLNSSYSTNTSKKSDKNSGMSGDIDLNTTSSMSTNNDSIMGTGTHLKQNNIDNFDINMFSPSGTEEKTTTNADIMFGSGFGNNQSNLNDELFGQSNNTKNTNLPKTINKVKKGKNENMNLNKKTTTNNTSLPRNNMKIHDPSDDVNLDDVWGDNWNKPLNSQTSQTNTKPNRLSNDTDDFDFFSQTSPKTNQNSTQNTNDIFSEWDF